MTIRLHLDAFNNSDIAQRLTQFLLANSFSYVSLFCKYFEIEIINLNPTTSKSEALKRKMVHSEPMKQNRKRKNQDSCKVVAAAEIKSSSDKKNKAQHSPDLVEYIIAMAKAKATDTTITAAAAAAAAVITII